MKSSFKEAIRLRLSVACSFFIVVVSTAMLLGCASLLPLVDSVHDVTGVILKNSMTNSVTLY